MARASDTPHVQPLLLRAREVATTLGVSQSQVGIWTRAGILKAVKIPGIRAVRFAREDVEALAHKWRTEAGAA